MKNMNEHGRVEDLGKLPVQNEIVFVMDSVGWREFIKSKTPNCNKIGKTEKAYSSSYYTPPSILAMMRGNVPQPWNRCYWPYGRYSTTGEHNFVPASLGEKGYNTYLITNNLIIDDKHQVGDNFVAYIPYFKNYISDWKDSKSSRKLIKRFTGQVREPFYAFFLFLETHTPYLSQKGNLRRSNQGQINAIEFLDKSFGQLRNALLSKHLKNDTRVIITADHSESWDNHLEHKGHNPTRLWEYMRDGSLRRLMTVPLIHGKL